MAKSIHLRLFVLITLPALIVTGIALAGRVTASPDSAPKTLDRDLEPVVIKAHKAVSLIGTPVDELFVYVYSGSGWDGQIPYQVDEVTSSGNFVSADDGLLNGTDEIVFMVKDLGDRAPVTEPLTATLTISDTWYEIEVSDPLSPSKKGWAYLVRSNALSPSFSGDYVDYKAASQRIATGQYELGFATADPSPFFGLNYLALSGSGVDILDRTKLRVGISGFSLTEENLTNNLSTDLIKDGPVRALVSQMADVIIVGRQETIYKAYAQMVQVDANASFSGLSVSSVRTSIDHTSAISSSATFYNANTAGVPIDGAADDLAETPLSTWSQVSHTSGRYVQVSNPSSAGGTPKNYYRDDDSTADPDDTGEPGYFGDSGVQIDGSLNATFSIESSLFFLPPAGGGGADNVGNQYGDYFANPLTVIARSMAGDGSVFLPLIIKN